MNSNSDYLTDNLDASDDSGISDQNKGVVDQYMTNLADNNQSSSYNTENSIVEDVSKIFRRNERRKSTVKSIDISYKMDNYGTVDEDLMNNEINKSDYDSFYSNNYNPK